MDRIKTVPNIHIIRKKLEETRSMKKLIAMLLSLVLLSLIHI